MFAQKGFTWMFISGRVFDWEYSGGTFVFQIRMEGYYLR